MGDVNEGVNHTTRIIDLSLWPDREGFTTFGDDDIDCLVNHFATVLEEAGVNTANILDKWTALKCGIYSQSGWLQYIQKTTWAEIARKYMEEFPNVFKLVDLVISLPASTVECEPSTQ